MHGGFEFSLQIFRRVFVGGLKQFVFRFLNFWGRLIDFLKPTASPPPTQQGCQSPDTPPNCDAGAGKVWKRLGSQGFFSDFADLPDLTFGGGKLETSFEMCIYYILCYTYMYT